MAMSIMRGPHIAVLFFSMGVALMFSILTFSSRNYEMDTESIKYLIQTFQ